MKHIQRASLLQSIKEVNNTPDIKIITGVRRSGKSQLLSRLKFFLFDGLAFSVRFCLCVAAYSMFLVMPYFCVDVCDEVVVGVFIDD